MTREIVAPAAPDRNYCDVLSSRDGAGTEQLREGGRAELTLAISPRRRSRRGMTLVELMMAMAISLIMIYAMIRFFGDLILNVADGRAAIEMSGQLRSTAQRLQSDLRGVTAPMRPWISPESGVGYFEYIEGRGTDADPFGLTVAPNPNVSYGATFGDFDDVLAFTTRSHGKPFIGQYRNRNTGVTAPIESHYAEVIWWASRRLNSLDIAEPDVLRPGQVTLHRRALLIRPDLALFDPARPGLVDEFPWTLPNVLDFYNRNDISVRAEFDSSAGVVRMWANSLASLTKRENRTAHVPINWGTATGPDPVVSFPFRLETDWAGDLQLRAQDIGRPSLFTLMHGGDKEGEDIMLANVAAFDVKAYDPHTPVLIHPGTLETVLPGDPGFLDALAGGPPVSLGAFVDLWYRRDPTSTATPPGTLSVTGPFANSVFARPPNPSVPGRSWNNGIYDTWSFHYEHDGVDQDGVLGPDQGTNGRDDNGTNGVDDLSERETSPPYPVPLRGIKVTIRLIEPDSRQVRQFSVVNDFTPE